MEKEDLTKEVLENARKEAGFSIQEKEVSFLAVASARYRRWLYGARKIPYMALFVYSKRKSLIILKKRVESKENRGENPHIQEVL